MYICPECKDTYNVESVKKCRRCKIELISLDDKASLKKYEEKVKQELYELEAEMGIHDTSSSNKISQVNHYYFIIGLTSIIFMLISAFLAIYSL